ncbi:MAG: hypothetical protein R3178_03615, partial [Rhodothermales bacterium]|nr:hypothetical protein [Rhodothermales bacterium]
MSIGRSSAHVGPLQFMHSLTSSRGPVASLLSVFILVSAVLLPTAVLAQEVPAEIQRELDRRGVTPEQAREQASRMGIDLDNPAQAVQRARELGIPEATIQRLLRAVEEPEVVPQPATTLPVLVDTTQVDVDSLRMLSEELARQKEAVESQTTTPLEEYGRQRQIRYFGYNL